VNVSPFRLIDANAGDSNVSLTRAQELGRLWQVTQIENGEDAGYYSRNCLDNEKLLKIDRHPAWSIFPELLNNKFGWQLEHRVTDEEH
jgi:hypothetical protein